MKYLLTLVLVITILVMSGCDSGYYSVYNPKCWMFSPALLGNGQLASPEELIDKYGKSIVISCTCWDRESLNDYFVQVKIYEKLIAEKQK